MKARDYAKSLDLDEGQEYRGKCPECGGSNTFTVSNQMGKLLFNCYKASCEVSGTESVSMSVESIEKIMRGESAADNYEEELLNRFDLPEYITPIKQDSADVRNFMTKWNINPDDVFYDVRQDRVVFPVYTEDNVLVDAVGRALDGRQPKWLRYAASPVPYVYGNGYIAVVVEDAISAYTVGSMFPTLVGVALLGTQLTDFHKWYLGHYWDQLYVALDPDARDKTLQMVHDLRIYVPDAMALNIEDDLKYMTEEDEEKLNAISRQIGKQKLSWSACAFS